MENFPEKPKSFFEYLTMDTRVPLLNKEAPFLTTLVLYGSIAAVIASLYYINQYDQKKKGV